MRALFPTSRFLIALIAVLLAATAASAQVLTVTPADEELEERLRGEALVLAPADEAEEGGAARSAGDLIATAKGDYGRLLAVLYEEGYFSASVSITLAGREASGLSTFAAREIEPIVVAVDLGTRFTFARAEIAPLAPGASAPEGFAPGAVAGTAVIQQAAGDAIDDWRAASHAKAEISDQRITARHSASELDVSLAIRPGPALRFGRLVLPPNASVRDGRLLKIAGLPAGEPFDPEDLRRVRQRLVNTGAFNSVVIREADAPNANDTLDIELALEAAPLRRIGFGAEIESTNGVSLEAFWLNRNFRGGAERLRFDAEVNGIGGTSGGIDYLFGTSYRIPGFRRADDTLELFLNLERQDEETFEENLLEFGIRRERQVNDTFVAGQTASYRFSQSRDDFGTREFSHLVLSADGELDRRDNSLNPTEGYFAFLELKPFIGIGESQTGLRIEGDARYYQSLASSTVLAARGQIGSVLFTDLEDTPPDFLFFSGGGGTVRGQGFQSLGVTAAGGEETGGRGFAGVSFEVRQSITEAISLVGFVDYGFISEGGDFSDGEGHAGAGIGFRYNTTLGPLRVDLGVPIGGSSDDTNYGLYIGLGQAF